jgi:hypothetical protein
MLSNNRILFKFCHEGWSRENNISVNTPERSAAVNSLFYENLRHAGDNLKGELKASTYQDNSIDRTKIELPSLNLTPKCNSQQVYQLN